MKRDIDYAADAVQRAFLDKFRDETSEETLHVTALERTILIEDRGMRAEGTRDELQGLIRKSATIENFWDCFPQRRIGRVPREA